MASETDQAPAGPTEAELDFAALSREFRDSLGPLELYADLVQEGIEVEAFGQTPAGEVLLGTAVSAVREALRILLAPSATADEVRRAVFELRVQHRVLQTYANAVNRGKTAARQIHHIDQTDDEES